MRKQSIIFEKSGGRRISLYAEVGRYFTADGVFDETTFRQIIHNALRDAAKDLSPQEGRISQGKWLSDYLSKVMDYLSEKDMSDAASRVCKTAVEEAANAGITEVALSPQHLKNMLQAASPVSTGKKKRQHALDEKRKKIYRAALKVFSEDGFHQATMNKIATLSGVAKGTVYEYFKSKEELLDQLLEERYEEIVERISAICDRGGDILEQTREMIEFWVGFIEENPQLYRLIQSEAIFRRSGEKVMFYDYMISHLPMFKERIVALNREKNLKTTSFYTTFYGILGFIDGVAHKWFRCQMDYPLKDEIPVILEVLFNGFVGEQVTRRNYFSPAEDE